MENASTEHQKELVIEAKADYHFNKEQYNEAAMLYSKLSCSFEGIALKFILIKQFDYLREYLLCKLENIVNEKFKENEPNAQITMILTWIIELYLDKFETFNVKFN